VSASVIATLSRRWCEVPLPKQCQCHSRNRFLRGYNTRVESIIILILGVTNLSTAVTGLCVVLRLVDWVYVIDADADGGVCVGGGGGYRCVLVEVRTETETETETATDALMDGNPLCGPSISLRSL
jgi:hypothetical protein